MIYVTGSSGFIGTHLLKRFEGNPITRIPHQQIDSVEYHKFDAFFFLSTYGNMFHHDDDYMTLKANLYDPTCTLLKVNKLKYGSFVYFSSSSVRLPIQTIYSSCKKATEEICKGFIQEYDKPIAVVRPYSVTGIGEQPEHLIPTLIRSCFTGEMVRFTPEPVHDYINVEDLVDAMVMLAETKARGIFEAGTGISHTNREVLGLVEKATGKKANVSYVGQMRPYDNYDWVCKNHILKSIYGWKPKISLEDTIAEMVEAYKSA